MSAKDYWGPVLWVIRRSRLLALHQSFPYPTWIPAAIKDSKNHNHIIDNTVIDSEWKSSGELTVVSENYLVNSSKVGE